MNPKILIYPERLGADRVPVGQQTSRSQFLLTINEIVKQSCGVETYKVGSE